MNIYEGIYTRRSVRKYKMEALDPELLKALKRFIGNAAPLDHTSRAAFEVIENVRGTKQVRGLWKVEAPYYLAVYCEENSVSYRNAGYLSEQIVLYLTSRGIGTCYLGETRTGDGEKDGLKRLLVIAFGYPDSQDSRTAKRSPLSELCVYKDEPGEAVKAILKAARLAPSSFNSQPWRFVVYADRIYIFAKKSALAPLKALSAMRDFNMGIMLSHIMLTAEELWVGMETVTEEQFLKKTYKNGDYVCTVVFRS